ncbi:MAG: nucleotide exchange factor GrpE [Clostridia bacterium]|nr:nucleotide exchange factor GrpE [Clostridia bacterium]
MSKQKDKNKEAEQKEAVNQTEETQAVTDENTSDKACEEAQKPADDKTAELEEKIKDWENKYKLLYAEFDNYRKRTTKEKDSRYADAVIDTVNVFLAVADNLDRAVAINVETEEAKKVLDGVELVKKQMSDILTKLDVTPIKSVGEEFDPNLHNAVMHIEDENVTDNTVVEEFQKGYIYKNERVVRHSMVKVAN